MGKYWGNRGKLVRRFQENIFGSVKYDRILDKKPYAPGVHKINPQRKKLSDYGQQLQEKQKLKIIYGLKEKQFRILFARADKKQGITGDNLLKMLEQRLDNVIYRCGWAKTRIAARQIVNHGHIAVNGRKVNIPSYSVMPNEVITIKNSTKSKTLINNNIELVKDEIVLPDWINISNENLTAKIIRLPLKEETEKMVKEQMIVELYSK